MSLKMKKGLALFLAVMIMLAGIPITAKAATTPAFQETFSTFYENRANQGIYDIQVNNVQKGYILKWHITGKGKKYASFDTQKTVAKGTTVTNKLTIDSNGEMAFAAGERIRITVNVYTAKWKLVNKITFAGKLQCKAKGITIDTTAVGDLKQLKTGQAYTFRAKNDPVKCNEQSILAGERRQRYGLFFSDYGRGRLDTAKESGEYTITATARNSAKGAALCTKQVQATVGTFIEKIEQTASNAFRLTFGTAPAVQFKEADFSIKSGETTIVVKKLKYAEDKKTVDVTTATGFLDAKTYTVTCAGYTKDFTASVGKPARLQITTASAQAGKYTKIEYAFFDAKGIDVTETIKNGTFRYSGNVTNGLIDQQTNQLFMTTVGSIANVTLEYTGLDGTRLEDTKTIVCVEQRAEEAAETKFTLTSSMSIPTFKDADVREIAIGDTMYAHFAAFNENGTAIAYDSISYSSSDPDSLIVNPDGKLTPIKAGTVTVVVLAMQGNVPVNYTYEVTIKAGRYLASIQMKETAIAMSNVNEAGYQKEIPITAMDQYGEPLALTNASGVITEAYGRSVATYIPENNSVLIRTQGLSANIYNCVLALTVNGITLNQNFTVIVSAPPSNGAYTYQVETSTSSMDLAIDENTDKSKVKAITVRLAEYRGGVFTGYVNFTSAQIRKGNITYTTDMIPSSGSAITGTSMNQIQIRPLEIADATDNNGAAMCRKAEPGIYTITLEYNQPYWYGTTGSSKKTVTANIEITDSQKAPEYNIKSLTTNATMQTALQMAMDCIQMTNNDAITACTVTGTTQQGASVLVKSGEQVHISTITVRSIVTIRNGLKVYVEHVVPIGRTFTNR